MEKREQRLAKLEELLCRKRELSSWELVKNEPQSGDWNDLRPSLDQVATEALLSNPSLQSTTRLET
jgi:hypothetical protein